MKVKVHSDGSEGYTKRVLERVRKLTHGKKIDPEIAITFEDPLKMAEVLTPERIRLCYVVRRNAYSVSKLAAELRRDPKSVRRDVVILERYGLVKTHLDANPGHGKVRIVEPAAKKLELRVAL